MWMILKIARSPVSYPVESIHAREMEQGKKKNEEGRRGELRVSSRWWWTSVRCSVVCTRWSVPGGRRCARWSALQQVSGPRPVPWVVEEQAYARSPQPSTPPLQTSHLHSLKDPPVPRGLANPAELPHLADSWVRPGP